MAGYESRWEEDERFYPSSHSDDSPIITYRHDRPRRRSTLTVLAKFFVFCAAMIIFCMLMYIPVYNRANYVPKDGYKRGMAAVAGWTNQTNRDIKIYVQPNNVTTIHEPTNVCPKLSRQKKNNLFLLIIVCSATKNFEIRNAIRETWGSYDNYIETSKIFNKVKDRYKNYNYTYDLYSQEEELRYLNNISLNIINSSDVSSIENLKKYVDLNVKGSFNGLDNVTVKKHANGDIKNDNKVRFKRDISISKILPELAKVLQSNLVTMKTDNVPDKEEKEENRFENEVDESEKEIDVKEDLFQDFDMNKELAEDKTERYDDYNYESNVMKIPPKGYEDNQDLNKILKLLKQSKTFTEDSGKSKTSNINLDNSIKPDKNFPEHKEKSKTGNIKPDFKLLFLLGLPPQINDTDTQNKIDEEMERYGDVIQEGFVDSYNNLTLKSIMMLKWVNNNCGDSVRYILKSDDDMYLNVPYLMMNLRKRAEDFDAKALGDEKEYLLIGDLITGAKPVLDSNQKWYSPRYMYAGRLYPRYLSGTGYALSAAAAAALYAAALRTPYFHLEDVYITGMCPLRARPRLAPRDEPLFSYEAVRAAAACGGLARATAHRASPPCLRQLQRRAADERHVDRCERMRLTQVRRDRLKPKPPPKKKPVRHNFVFI